MTSSFARRAAFLTSTAAGLALATAPAQAQTGLSINTVQDTAHNYLTISDVSETPNVTINNNFTTTDARDTNNITGIGQMFINNGNGTVGLCTGSLINPRTVIFAAHCVNSRAATAYGNTSGGVPIAFGFETNTRANAAGQPDELINWFNGGSTGPGQGRTNTAQALYNALQVFYNPASLAPASCTNPTSCFLEADIAMAAFDTPTRNIPLWTLLFSPLATPAAINPATGTGYHVGIAGYGAFGNGTTGSASGSDFRRRVAENMLGALTSINSRNQFLFGTTGTPSRPQVLYWTDFDDPRRGTAAADPEDFNGFRDNALTREGLTGPGDSGGPLIIDQAFARPTIIGVLSGGSTFFAGQPGGSYGTQSFYQPLFLYWDWIVANNPYRYATAVAGDRNWEDAASWVTTLDPAYQILSGGQLTNGLPTELGGQISAVPQFGEVCFQSPSSGPPYTTNECQNLATGAARNNVPNTPTGTADTSSPVHTQQIAEAAQAAEGEVQVATASSGATEQSANGSGRLAMGDASDVAISDRTGGGGATDVAIIDGAVDVAISDRTGGGGSVDVAIADRVGGGMAVEEPFAAPGYRDGPLPAPSIANGLPGATNFVPNNSNGVRATGVSARYYDITLRNAGTVTLSSTVTIDRLAIAGAGSALSINGNADLTSLIDITQTAGRMNVNGFLRSPGDYALIGGVLNGGGTVVTPFLTSVLGTIAPGQIGTIGSLTVAGNVVMSSGTQTAIDLGTGESDRLITRANGTSTGLVTLGGALLLNPVTRATFGSTYSIITSSSQVQGTFASVNSFSALLFPVVTYTTNSVNVRINARAATSVVNPNSPIQVSFARLIDGNRENYAALADFYGPLDVLSQADLQAALEAAAPRAEATGRSLGRMSTDAMARFYRDRINFLSGGDAGGTLTMVGNPVQLAAAASNGMVGNAMGGLQTMSDGGSNMVQTRGGLPEDVSAYVAGGFLNGRADPLPTLLGGRDEIDGWYIAGGVELERGEGQRIGFGVHFASTDGRSGATQRADGELIQGTFYTVNELGGGFVGQGQLSVGRYSVDTRRVVTVGTTTFTLNGRNNAFAASGELGFGRRFEFGGGLTLTPNVAGRYTLLDFGDYQETGGAFALVYDGPQYESFQGRVGLDLGGEVGGGSWRVSPRLTAAFVHEFLDQNNRLIAGFAATGFLGGAQPFLLPNADRNWGEIGGGVRIGGERVSFDLGIDSTIARGDVNYQTYRAGVSIRF